MKYILTLLFGLSLIGCAAVTKWEPVVNTKVDKHPETLATDIEECRGLAYQAAGFVSEGASNTLVSSAGAAAEGAIIGTLSGAFGAGVGAAVGAAGGAVAGLWWGEYNADLEYKRAYSNCLWQRQHYPIN